MRKITGILVAATVIALSSNCTARAGEADSIHQKIDFARDKVYPALVNISVVTRYFADGRALHAPAGGSGVIVSKDGYVLTNYHVAANASRIICTLVSGEALEATDIADDPLSDLSVLKLSLKHRENPGAPLHFATLGDSDSVQVGDFVMAMGNPLMLSSSLTLGVISNTHRVFTDFNGNQMEDIELDDGQKTGTFTRWIQHDALILPGNSGGPLVDTSGDVVGINELGGDGQGFAIPSNLARHVLGEVLRYGRVRYGWIGASILPVNKLGRTTGTLVSSTLPGSPAADDNLIPGDIILSLNGKPTNTRYLEQVPLFYQLIASCPIGQSAQFVVLRGAHILELNVRIDEMEKYLGDEVEFRNLGVTVRSITREMAVELHLPDSNGVVVTGVRPGFPMDSAQPQIVEGDILRTIGGKSISGVKEFGTLVARLKDTKVSLGLLRGDEQMVSVADLSPEPPQNDGDELPKGWLGVKTQVLIPDLAAMLGIGGTTGYRITEVLPWTAASRSGIKTGDILVALNGEELDASQPQDADELSHEFEDLNVGDKATLTIVRNGRRQDLAVTVEATPSSAETAKSFRQSDFEFTVRNVTLSDRADNHWSRSQPGVIVTEATEGGLATLSGLNVDDLIVSVNGVPVHNIDDLHYLIGQTIKHHEKLITLFIRREPGTLFVFIEPDWNKPSLP